MLTRPRAWTNNATLRKSAKTYAETTLPIVEQARTACGFEFDNETAPD